MIKAEFNKDKDLLVSSYDYDLDESLIAQEGMKNRSDSRLMVYRLRSKTFEHRKFSELDQVLSGDELLIYNRSKVFPARLLCKKESGGKAEIFFLSLVPNSDGLYEVMIKANRGKFVGAKFHLNDNCVAEIVELLGDSFLIKHDIQNLELFLEKYGLVPIPPYIRGGLSDANDKSRYQTVYAKEVGSTAAPTAGLHFDEAIREKLRKIGVREAEVVLHVGPGTFLPVKAENLAGHQMHTESYFIDQKNFEMISSHKKRVAVGTTTLRTLESWNRNKEFKCGQSYDTDIFLHPGVEINTIHGLLTNFHLPKSTLLMLLSALIGRVKALELYKEAQSCRYRFFSYGDAMLILDE